MTRPGILAILMILLVTVLLGVVSSRVSGGDAIYVGVRMNGSIPYDKVDHAEWDRLLQKYVDSDGYVDYQLWHASVMDRRSLSTYLETLSAANPQAKSSRNAKLAFWMNAYNAVTVHGILNEYPTTSIRNHTAKVFGYNIWKDLQLFVAGRPWSVEKMEHQILRKMGEPRIHFGIVCASVGCPRLLREAFTAENVIGQLEANAQDFFQRPGNFRYDSATKTFYLSEIFRWFGQDFGVDRAAQLRKISGWLPEPARTQAQRGVGGIAFLDYNWKLNDQKFR